MKEGGRFFPSREDGVLNVRWMLVNGQEFSNGSMGLANHKSLVI